MDITKKDIVIIAVLTGLLILSVLVAGVFGGLAGTVLPLVVSTVIVLTIILETYRRILKYIEVFKKDDDSLKEKYFQQTESLLSIYSTLDIKHPLPNTRGWAASPDLLKKLMETTLREKPQVVLEASSGISTLIIAYCLRQLGGGKVISLENDAKYAKISQDMVNFHGLGDIAQVIHAPLVDVEINNKKWLWYDVKDINIDAPIDLMVVDGPPASTQHLARYPALPIMFDSLADKATIVLDDGAREAETEIVRQWQESFNNITHEYLELEKGAYVIKKEG